MDLLLCTQMPTVHTNYLPTYTALQSQRIAHRFPVLFFSFPCPFSIVHLPCAHAPPTLRHHTTPSPL